MEDRRNHSIRVTIGMVTTALLALAGPVGAQERKPKPFDWRPTVTVKTNPDAVVVDSQVKRRVPGETTDASGSGSNCRLQRATVVGEVLWPDVSAYPAVKVFPFWVVCNGQLQGVVWIEWRPPQQGPPPTARSPREIAMGLREEIPVPTVTIRMNPERGLVGLESWFWIDGYDGSPITRSTNAFGSLIEVEANVLRYEWSFGDGSKSIGNSVGNPYPERSNVRHTYERSSLGHSKGYSVEVAFVFSVRYRVNGGTWIELPGITRSAQASYPVLESQAVIGE